MRINAKEQPEQAAKIAAVLLDGKLIKQCHAFDTQEGWVEFYMPNIPTEHDLKKNTVIQLGQVSDKIVRKYGKIKVAIREGGDL